MLVKMKTTKAGPNGVAHAGEQVEVTKQEGYDLVEGGFAEQVGAEAQSDEDGGKPSSNPRPLTKAQQKAALKAKEEAEAAELKAKEEAEAAELKAKEEAEAAELKVKEEAEAAELKAKGEADAAPETDAG